MIKNRKRFRIYYFIFIIISGLIIGAILGEKLKGELKFIYLLLFGIVLAIPSTIYQMRWNKKFMKKAQEVINILYVDKNPDLYIEKMNELIPQNSGRFFDNLRDMNLAAAYYFKEDYKKSEDLLESIDPKKLKGENVLSVYYVDLALTKFNLGKTDEATKIMDENEKYFEVRNLIFTYNYDASASFAKCYYYIAKGEDDKAREKANEIYEKYGEHYNKKDIENIKNKLK